MTNDSEVYTKKIRHIKPILIIHSTLSVMIIFWLITPVVYVIPFSGIHIVFGMYFFWLILSLLLLKKFVPKLLIDSIWLIVWLIILSLWLISGKESLLINHIINMISIFIIYSIFYYYYLSENKVVPSLLALTVLLSFALTAFITIVAITNNPLISRQLATYGGYSESTFVGIGSFYYVYASALIIPILFARIDKKISLKNLIIISLLGLYIFTIIYTTFLTALLMMIFVSAMVIVIRRKLLSAVYFLVITLILVISREEIGYYFLNIAQNFTNDEFRLRFIEIGHFLTGQTLDNSTSFGARQLGNLQSISTFLKNPFSGVGGYYANDHYLFGIGNHSQWLDDIARYGLIYLILISFMLKQFLKIYNQFNNQNYKNTVIISLVYIITLGFLNPIYAPPLFVVLFIFLPFSQYLFEKNNDTY